MHWWFGKSVKASLEFPANFDKNESAVRAHFTVVGFKLSGPFKFFFDVINVRVTFLDAKGPIKWACDKIQGFFHIFYPYSAQNM